MRISSGNLVFVEPALGSTYSGTLHLCRLGLENFPTKSLCEHTRAKLQRSIEPLDMGG
jgi:hypothetical protein